MPYRDIPGLIPLAWLAKKEKRLAITYEIDTGKGLVTTTISGTLSFDECNDHHYRLGADPAFAPSYNELIDGGNTEQVELFSKAIFSLAESCPFGPDSFRAINAGCKKVHFGLARMFQAFATGRHGTIEVFRSREEALQWLDRLTLVQ